MLIINGKEFHCGGEKLSSTLINLGFNVARIAVELNGTIVSGKEYDNTVLMDGDKIEVVSFVGGG